jgi:dolichyl-phosphate-mannose--protein O-mannosyl transferase
MVFKQFFFVSSVPLSLSLSCFSLTFEIVLRQDSPRNMQQQHQPTAASQKRVKKKYKT